MPSISYAVTVCNEHEELTRLAQKLLPYLRDEDELIIQVDENTVTSKVKKVIKNIIEEDTSDLNRIHSIYFPLNKDFATFKNNLKNNCAKDYIFFIDADEYPDDYLLEVLPDMLIVNPTVDLFLVARINTVKGITPEHIAKWAWRVDDRGYINYPDYQTRIIVNKREIEWAGKVHEKITGFKTLTQLPANVEQLALHHPKTIERQEKQNSFYNTI